MDKLGGKTVRTRRPSDALRLAWRAPVLFVSTNVAFPENEGASRSVMATFPALLKARASKPSCSP